MSKVGEAYADVKICMLGTLACCEDRQSARDPMPSLCADAAKLAAIQTPAWCDANPDAEVVASVTDNGDGGEGLCLQFSLEYTVPLPDGSHMDGGLFAIYLSAQQALALAGALRAAVDMRVATGDDGR